MKIIISYLLFITLAVFSAYSQTNFSEYSGFTNTLTGAAYGGSTVWVCGPGGVVQRSTDNGTTWQDKRDGLPVTNYHIIFTGQYFASQNAAMYFTIAGIPYAAQTSNGGTNWIWFPIPWAFYIWAQEYYDELEDYYGDNSIGDTILIGGDPSNGRWSLAISTNNGLSFDTTGLYVPQQGGEFGWEYCMESKKRYVWFGANNPPGVYRGYRLRNWQRLAVPGLNWVYSMWFTDTAKGMVGGDNGILYTTNKGDSWTMLSIGGSGGVKCICTPGSGNWWAARGGGIWFSSNNGSSWKNIYTAPTGNYNYIAIDSTRHRLVGIRDNGGVTIGVSTIGIRPVSNEIPKELKLEQNYPNPFNPNSKIKFQISKLSEARLIVYDVLGKETQILVNERLSPGTYEVEFGGGNLPSGVYFYQLISDENVETKKMVLIR